MTLSTLPTLAPGSWREEMRRLSPLVLEGLQRTLATCARETAAQRHGVARENAVDVFLRLGGELGIPAVVLRQLVEDAQSYDFALEAGSIIVEKSNRLACDTDSRICENCHEWPCLCEGSS